LKDKHRPELVKLDEIEVLLSRRGVTLPHLDRLARIASDMHQLEWKLARQNRPPAEDLAPSG
jgi:hypothetical protein